MINRNRKYLIAGNWKMNKTATEACHFATELVKSIGKQGVIDVVICAPFTALCGLAKILEDFSVAVGAQNLNPQPSGAFTGEISAEMLCEHCVSYVIIGHSERRTLFNEDNTFINNKVKAALKAKINPILCVGETLEEREAGNTLNVIKKQMEEGLQSLLGEAIEGLVIAYEPIWAIGTGKTATPAMAQEVHAAIRHMLEEQLGLKGRELRVIYGGSMKPENVEELLMQPDIDGGLIGGASLKIDSFIQLIESTAKIVEMVK